MNSPVKTSEREKKKKQIGDKNKKKKRGEIYVEAVSTCFWHDKTQMGNFIDASAPC